MIYHSKDDGVKHINAYSRGRTELGRFLSHFAYHPIEIDEGQFVSNEGLWYWLETGYEPLRGVYGLDAKRMGQDARKLPERAEVSPEHFRSVMLRATDTKIKTMPEQLLKEFLSCRLPLVHYYPNGEGKGEALRGMDFILDRMIQLRTYHKFYKRFP